MITLTEVTLANFFSVGQAPQRVDLAAAGLTLVLGRNADAAANARNGVGKTTLARAIHYALTGESLANIRLDNLVNNINNRAMRVSLRFTRDGKSYRIERGRKPNLLKFFVNDIIVSQDVSAIADPATGRDAGEIETDRALSTDRAVDTALGANRHTQVEIDRVLGMSPLLLRHLVLLTTDTMPFLRAKPAEQREVIEELFGISQLSRRDEALRLRSLATKEVIRTAEATLKATAEANDRISAAIEQAGQQRRAWQHAQAATLAKLAAEIAAVTRIDFAVELALFDAIDAWVAADRDLRASRAGWQTEAASLNREIARLDAEAARQLQGSRQPAETRIARLQGDLQTCELAAAATPQAEVARLAADAARRRADARLAGQRATTSEAEQGLATAAMRDTDGHVCATCGQGLRGTEHLASVLATLAAAAETHGAAARRWHAETVRLETEATAIDGEITGLTVRHAEAQAACHAQVAALRGEIAAAHAALADAEAAADDALAERAAARASRCDALAARQADIMAVDAGLATLGAKPASQYRARADIWTLREAAGKLVQARDLEAARDNPHDAAIASLRATLQPLDDAGLRAAELALKHEDFLHRLLTGKDSFIRKRIVDQNLGYLNRLMNRILAALGLPHEVCFLPDLSCEISLLGRVFDFEQLSRGEMNRVVLATCWAFRDVWESLNTKCNLLLVDEFADNGMDDAGAEAVAGILHKMVCEQDRNIFLISHKEAVISRINRVLLVHKENGFTRYEDNAEF